jgi:hypothetical protein
MNEVLGLNREAWERWMTYKKSIRKPYKQASIELAQKKLASFGEWQMQVVEQSIERGWTGLFELPKKELRRLQDEKRQMNRDAELLENLRERARKVGYRDFMAGEDLGSYKFLIERAERDDAERRWRDSRKGPQGIATLIGRLA